MLPVKLKVFDSLFVPLAKWAMPVTGNYRCVTEGDTITIKEAVHGDVEWNTARCRLESVSATTARTGAVDS